MNLPGEIRNRIWRLVLPRQLLATKTHPRVELPAISTTCKHALQETIGLLLKERELFVQVQDWDAAFSTRSTAFRVRWRSLAKRLGSRISLPRTYIDGSGSPHWRNLMAWTKAEHARYQGRKARHPINLDDGRASAHLVVAAVFNASGALWKMGWVDVEPVLESLHAMATRIDPRWA